MNSLGVAKNVVRVVTVTCDSENHFCFPEVLRSREWDGWRENMLSPITAFASARASKRLPSTFLGYDLFQSVVHAYSNVRQQLLWETPTQRREV